MTKSLSNRKYLIWRVNKQTGFYEETIFTGNLKHKPKGWRVREEI